MYKINVLPNFAAGWGTLKEEGTVSIDLMAVNVTVIPTKICNKIDSYNGQVDKNAFCAGYMEGGKDSCQVSIIATLLNSCEFLTVLTIFFF